MVDYQKTALQKRNKQGEFTGNRLKSSHVVGAAVESFLKLSFRPKPGVLPILDLKAADLTEVVLHDVLKPGSNKAGSISVALRPEDAVLSVSVAKAIIEALQGPEYRLQIHVVDHQGPGSSQGSHDILASPYPGLKSKFKGLVSVEIKCREVLSRQGFPREATLQEECLPLFLAEQSGLVGRLLLFVEMRSPCRSGPFNLHPSVYTAQKGWERLWGWWGFGPMRRLQDQTYPETPQSKKPRLATKPSPSPVLDVKPALEQVWESVAKQLRPVDGWVPLASYLDVVGLPKNQALRYVKGNHRCTWTSPTGGAPRQRLDWMYKKTSARGGGQGHGPLNCSINFLRHVFIKHSSTWKK